MQQNKRERAYKVILTSIARRGETIYLPLIALVWGNRLQCCPRSNALETATHAYRHLANGTELEKRVKRTKGGRTDGRTNGLQIALWSLWAGS